MTVSLPKSARQKSICAQITRCRPDPYCGKVQGGPPEVVGSVNVLNMPRRDQLGHCARVSADSRLPEFTFPRAGEYAHSSHRHHHHAACRGVHDEFPNDNNGSTKKKIK